MLDRATLLNKLNAFLDKLITEDEIHEWTLAQVVHDNYQKQSEEDPLLSAVVQTFMNLPGRQRPPDKVWEYYRQCLSGAQEFEADVFMKIWGQSTHRPSPSLSSAAINFKKPFPKWVLLLRIYIVLFAVTILGIHLVSLFDPQLLSGDEDLSRTEILKESLPQIVYAVILLLPLRIVVRGLFLVVSLPFVLFGVYYYARIAVEMVPKFSLPPVFLVLLLPFSALPALLALFLHFWAWKRSRTLTT